jgi:hypothetical protein
MSLCSTLGTSQIGAKGPWRSGVNGRMLAASGDIFALSSDRLQIEHQVELDRGGHGKYI